MCYRLDNTALGYVIVISSILLIYTIIFYPGLRQDGFNIFMGGSPILKFVGFDEIKSVKIGKGKNNDLDLIIKAHGTTYRQTYDLKNKDFNIKNIDNKTNLTSHI